VHSDSIDSDEIDQSSYWKARLEFYNSAQPWSEEQEKKMMGLAVEARKKEIERKRLLQHQKDMEQIKQMFVKD